MRSMAETPRLTLGSRGPDVVGLQLLLGATRRGGFRADGRFGPLTDSELARRLRVLGTSPLSEVTPATWERLRAAREVALPIPVPRRATLPASPPLPVGGAWRGALPGGSSWPVRTLGPHGREVAIAGPRAFGARRPRWRRHVGVDLYAREGDVLVAPVDVEIVAARPFYRGTWAVFCYSAELGITINLGEVAPHSWRAWGLSVGSHVEAGRPVAMAGIMRHTSMLHFETYRGRVTRPQRYFSPGRKGRAILDPTGLLVELAQGNEEDVSPYGGGCRA